MNLGIDELLRLDYAIVALVGGILALLLDRLIYKIRKRGPRRRRLRLSSWSRRILSLGLLAVVFSGWQFYRDGRVAWPVDLYYALHDTVSSAAAAEPATASQLQSIDSIVGRVTEVIDGDSIELIDAEGILYEIRLYGIDAPEWNQPYGNNAERALSRKLRNRTVRVQAEDIDSYGRLVGTVYYNDENINLQMVREGHGWWYRQYAREERQLAEAEELARQAGIGLWRRSNPVPPWEWRRR